MSSFVDINCIFGSQLFLCFLLKTYKHNIQVPVFDSSRRLVPAFLQGLNDINAFQGAGVLADFPADRDIP